MSLNLSSDGVAYNSTAVLSSTIALGAVNAATFDAGNPTVCVGKLVLLVDTALLDANLADLSTPEAMEVEDGAELVVVNAASKKITYTDPNTGYTLDYVNKKGESMTLIASNNTWIVGF